MKTGRLQYSATGGAGDRYFLMAHAHGFIDALYSRGMITTFEVLSALAGPLLAALDEDKFSRDRFAYAERLQHAMLRQSDRVVNNSYRSFPSFPLWNAWLRVWLIAEIFGDLRLFSVCVKYLETGDKAEFSRLDDDPLPTMGAEGESLMEDLYRFGDATFDRWEAGEPPPTRRRWPSSRSSARPICRPSTPGATRRPATSTSCQRSSA